MPCTKCKSDFNFFNWKIKCGECDDKYCNKCLKKREGVLYCDKCMILLNRPPDRGKLMELKPKDLQDYLRKQNISTHGLVEKQELVDLFCDKHIPVKPKRGTEKFTANIACSLPNFRESVVLNDFLERRQEAAYRSPAPQPQPRVNPYPSRPPPPTPPFTAPENYFIPAPESPNRTSSQNIPSVPSPVSQPTTSNASDTVLESNSAHQHVIETPEGSPLPLKHPKLSDFKSLVDLNDLSTRQLKTLLTLNRVNYKGCVEKNELLDRAKRLWTDNKTTKASELPENVEDLCKLCMDAPLECVLLECGHIATCIDCGKQLAECPICRQYVSRVVRTFKA